VDLGGFRIFTQNGTFTVPANINRIRIVAVGGGGAGGIADSDLLTFHGGGGGAGGAVVSSDMMVTPGQSFTVQVGAGGSATNNANASMSNGKPSMFGAVTAAGGGQGLRGRINVGEDTSGYGGTGGGSGGGAGGLISIVQDRNSGAGGVAGGSGVSNGFAQGGLGTPWGPLAGYITKVPFTAGAAGVAGSNSEGGGGGGGLTLNNVVIKATTPDARDGNEGQGSDRRSPANGGFGYGAGGAGGGDEDDGKDPMGNDGAPGAVYVEW